MFGRMREELKRVVGKSSSIATPYGLDGLGLRPVGGREFSYPSRPALGFIQPPIRYLHYFFLSRGFGHPLPTSTEVTEGK